MSVIFRDDSLGRAKLIKQVSIFSQEVIDDLTIFTLLELSRGGWEKADNNTSKEVRSKINVIDYAMNTLRGQKTLVQASI